MTDLMPVDVWSRSHWGDQQVVGERYHEQALRRLLPGKLPMDGIDQPETALLVREPHNKYDSNAVRVEIRGQHVGYLPAEDARRYRPIFDHMANGGCVPRVKARMWARPRLDYVIDRTGEMKQIDTGKINCDVTLALPEPHLVIPMNPPPSEPHAVLPLASALIVRTEGIPNQVFEPCLNVEGEARVHITLHRDIEALPRSTRERVAVRLNGQLAGWLTPATSNKFLPIINTLAEQGRLCVSPALLRGNKLHVELKICGDKAATLSADWLLENANHAVISRNVPEPPTDAPPSAVPPPPPVPPGPVAGNQPVAGPEDGVPGWFADPQGMAEFRFWDGTTWTSRIRTRMP